MNDLEALLRDTLRDPRLDLTAPLALSGDVVRGARRRRLRRRGAGFALPVAAAVAAGTVGLGTGLVGDRQGQAPTPGVAAAEPELGQVRTPEDLRTILSEQDGSGPVPERADVLARYTTGGVAFTVVGVALPDGTACTHRTDSEAPSLGSSGCGRLSGYDTLPGLTVNWRSGGRVLFPRAVDGVAPVGARTVALAADGGESFRVPVSDPGSAWAHRPRFHAPWPAGGTVVVTALDADGTVLDVDRSLRPWQRTNR